MESGPLLERPLVVFKTEAGRDHLLGDSLEVRQHLGHIHFLSLSLKPGQVRAAPDSASTASAS